jgi:hypothetical protein
VAGCTHDGVLGPAVAGSWYPARPEALERQVDDLLRRAAPGGAVSPGRAVIAPHAGFAYSGSVAARGFAALDVAGVERVLLLGPSHHAAFDGAVVPRAGACRTPLGDVPIDAAAVATLVGRTGFRDDDGPFRREHCLEAELPFLQRRLTRPWRVVPVLIGFTGSGAAQALADALRPLLGPGLLVVVSSDFTHYGPRFDFVPFTDRVPEQIEALDREALGYITAQDAPGFDGFLDRSRATVCGQNPIRVLLRLLPPGGAGRLVAYDTSGRITGEWDHSVSYASVVFPWTPA